MNRQEKIPAIFVSHGAPTLAHDFQAPAHQFIKELGNSIAKPQAILVISAHWQAHLPTISNTEKPETIHDFGGFSEDLYQIEYPAQGATELAHRSAALLADAQIEYSLTEDRGFDHGVWIPLMLMYPFADVPVTQLSLKLKGSATEHFEIGKALKPLRNEGVMILATGSAVHNLRYLSDEAKPLDWAEKFDEFLYQKILSGNLDELLRFRAKCPESQLAHPTDEHLLPLFVAMGAGGFDSNHPGSCLHRSWTYGSLSMASYSFDAR